VHRLSLFRDAVSTEIVKWSRMENYFEEEHGKNVKASGSGLLSNMKMIVPDDGSSAFL
jgi:hypothetical protein